MRSAINRWEITELSVLSCIYGCNLNKQFAASENIPPQSREVVLSRNGNCFYRALVLRRDEINDEKHE